MSQSFITNAQRILLLVQINPKPDFIDHRLKMFDAIKARKDAEYAREDCFLSMFEYM